ncbi:hypothetical protein FGG78_19390, partial [Thioclava sp. BHET1]
RCPYAIDRCRSERPHLTRADESGRQVACHRAAELTLAGLAHATTERSDAARRRFDLYRRARASETGAGQPVRAPEAATTLDGPSVDP